MQSQTYPILINLFAAVVGAGGQYLYKAGSLKLREVPIYLNWQLISGAILFTGVMGLFIWSFRIGGKLSVTYPMYATTFIWGCILGIVIDKETWNMGQLAGLVLVVAGISTIAYYSNNVLN
jgi:multidrug transporter EmrE-like cation transporter